MTPHGAFVIGKAGRFFFFAGRVPERGISTCLKNLEFESARFPRRQKFVFNLSWTCPFPKQQEGGQGNGVPIPDGRICIAGAKKGKEMEAAA
jgi:hypothetical protein